MSTTSTSGWAVSPRRSPRSARMLGSDLQLRLRDQLENLQNADRFYYLERLDGLNLLAQLEGNSFAELIARNTTAVGPRGRTCSRGRTSIFNLASLRSPVTRIADDPNDVVRRPEHWIDERDADLVRARPNGTIRYSGGRARHLERQRHARRPHHLERGRRHPARQRRQRHHGRRRRQRPAHRRRRRRHPHRHLRRRRHEGRPRQRRHQRRLRVRSTCSRATKATTSSSAATTRRKSSAAPATTSSTRATGLTRVVRRRG